MENMKSETKACLLGCEPYALHDLKIVIDESSMIVYTDTTHQ